MKFESRLFPRLPQSVARLRVPTTSALLGGLMLACAAPAHAEHFGTHSVMHGHTHHHAQPHAGHVYLVPVPAHGGYASPSPKPAYAYGWFGVKPRRHKGVHHGYYHHHTQWSFR